MGLFLHLLSQQFPVQIRRRQRKELAMEVDLDSLLSFSHNSSFFRKIPMISGYINRYFDVLIIQSLFLISISFMFIEF